MRLFIVLTACLFLHVSAHAQEEAAATEEASQETAETATETASEPATEEKPAAPEEKYVSCEDMYANYVRGLPKAKQAGELDIWWSLADGQYWYTRRNEFEYKEQKVAKAKDFEKALAASQEPTTIAASVKVGSYDFKKKGFPIEIATDKKMKYLENYTAGTAFNSGLGGGRTAYVNCPAGINVEPINKQMPPSAARFKFSNLDKLKFIAVPEDKAKAITGALSSSRTIQMTFKFTPGSSSLKKAFYGGPDIVTEAKVSSITLGHGEEAFDLKL